MKTRKQEIRNIVLDIISGREKVQYEPNQYAHLKLGLQEVMVRRGLAVPGRMSMDVYPELSADDAMILNEVFWDLFVERVITLGVDEANTGFPWFRVHSEWQPECGKRQS